jgi:hypothetical protein
VTSPLAVAAGVFLVLQVLLLVAAQRARAHVAGHPRSLASRLLLGALGVAAVLFFLATLIPRPHGRNWEGIVIGDLRTFTSAQVSYQATSTVYARPECLVEPPKCLPGYQGPTFLDALFLSPERSVQRGYDLTFHPGPEANAPPVASGPGVRGPLAWAMTAVPNRKETRDRRSFCVDASGVIRFAEPPSTVAVVNAECAPGLAVVQ